MKKVKIDEAKLGDFQYWEELFNTPEEKFQKLKKETKIDILNKAYSKAPDYVRLNKKWVMEGLTKFCFYFFNIDESLKDKEYCLEYVETNRHPSLFGIPKEYQAELFEKIVIKNPWEIRDIFYEQHLSHFRNKENYMKWIRLNPEIYNELMRFKTLEKDFELAEVAVKTNLNMLFDMPKSIARKIVNQNLEMMLAYMEKNIKVFMLLPLKVRNDKEFILKIASKLNYECVPFIGKSALAHKEVILAINSFYQLTLSELPENFHKDKEVAYHITRNSLYIDDCFKDCENFTLIELIKDILLETKSIHFYKRLTESQKRNPEIINAFLEINMFKKERENKYQHGYYNYMSFDSSNYVNTSVVTLLPEEIQTQLMIEWKETTEEDRDPEEMELLIFAQMKYLRVVLSSGMEQKANVDKLKL